MNRGNRNENAGAAAARSGARYIGKTIVTLVILLILGGIYGIIHTNNGFLVRGKTEDLTGYLTGNQEELPVGKYVRLERYIPVGEYASEETTHYTFFVDNNRYYVILLEDMTILSARISSKNDAMILDQWSESFRKSHDKMDFSVNNGLILTGKLTRLTNQKVIEYFEKAANLIGFPVGSKAVRYLLLDATAVRVGNVLLYLVLPFVLLVCLLILFLKLDKKRRQEKQRKAAAELEREGYRLCPVCGAVVDIGVKYCTSCSMRLVD